MSTPRCRHHQARSSPAGRCRRRIRRTPSRRHRRRRTLGPESGRGRSASVTLPRSDILGELPGTDGEARPRHDQGAVVWSTVPWSCRHRRDRRCRHIRRSWQPDDESTASTVPAARPTVRRAPPPRAALRGPASAGSTALRPEPARSGPARARWPVAISVAVGVVLGARTQCNRTAESKPAPLMDVAAATHAAPSSSMDGWCWDRRRGRGSVLSLTPTGTVGLR